MVVVQKKRTMPDNKKMTKKITNINLPEVKVVGKKKKQKVKDYSKEVEAGISEALTEVASRIPENVKKTGKSIQTSIKNLTKKNKMKKDTAFKLKSGNKPSIAKFMGIDKTPAKKLPEVEGSKSKKIDFSKMTDKQVEQALVRQIKKGYNLNEAEADTLFQGRDEVKRRILLEMRRERLRNKK